MPGALSKLMPLALAATASAALMDLGNKDVIVQMFGWPWESIASECTTHLGPAGYGYVQTSTPHEHITGDEWWTDYQVVSYKLLNKRGNRAEFANMVKKCNAAGVDIIIDLISNHMTGTTDTGTFTGFGGSEYSRYSYPAAGYNADNFHYCAGDGTAVDISDYTNRTDVQTCEEAGLEDLAQDQEVVQDRLAKYMNDLMSLGVVGFRVDSGVQQAASNLSTVFDMLDNDWWATFEVDSDSSSAVQQNEYWGMGATMLFAGTRELEHHFTTKGIANMVTPTPMGPSWDTVGHMYPESNKANFFVLNHDFERGYGDAILPDYDNNAYVLGHVFILAFNYGHPEVYSGFDFDNEDQGAPADANGKTNPVTCGQDGWRCEHRTRAIANMVGFHNAVAGADLKRPQKGTDQQIAFERDGKGFVAINNEASAWSKTFRTGIPDGTYCEVIHNPSNSTSCSDITVANGRVNLTIDPYDAAAFYVRS